MWRCCRFIAYHFHCANIIYNYLYLHFEWHHLHFYTYEYLVATLHDCVCSVLPHRITNMKEIIITSDQYSWQSTQFPAFIHLWSILHTKAMNHSWPQNHSNVPPGESPKWNHSTMYSSLIYWDSPPNLSDDLQLHCTSPPFFLLSRLIS